MLSLYHLREKQCLWTHVLLTGPVYLAVLVVTQIFASAVSYYRKKFLRSRVFTLSVSLTNCYSRCSANKHYHHLPGGFLGAFAKLRKATVAFLMSVRSHGETRLPLDGVSWNLIFEFFRNSCRENSSFLKMRRDQRALYMQTYVHLWYYLAEVFLEWGLFQIKSITFFRKSCRLWDNVEKCNRDGEATYGNIIRCMHFSCWITKVTNTYS
jgi:hypothetical protein